MYCRVGSGSMASRKDMQPMPSLLNLLVYRTESVFLPICRAAWGMKTNSPSLMTSTGSLLAKVAWMVSQRQSTGRTEGTRVSQKLISANPSQQSLFLVKARWKMQETEFGLMQEYRWMALACERARLVSALKAMFSILRERSSMNLRRFLQCSSRSPNFSNWRMTWLYLSIWVWGSQCRGLSSEQKNSNSSQERVWLTLGISSKYLSWYLPTIHASWQSLRHPSTFSCLATRLTSDPLNYWQTFSKSASLQRRTVMMVSQSCFREAEESESLIWQKRSHLMESRMGRVRIFRAALYCWSMVMSLPIRVASPLLSQFHRALIYWSVLEQAIRLSCRICTLSASALSACCNCWQMSVQRADRQAFPSASSMKSDRQNLKFSRILSQMKVSFSANSFCLTNPTQSAMPMREMLTMDLKLYQIIRRVKESATFSMLPMKNSREIGSMMVSAKVQSSWLTRMAEQGPPVQGITLEAESVRTSRMPVYAMVPSELNRAIFNLCTRRTPESSKEDCRRVIWELAWSQSTQKTLREAVSSHFWRQSSMVPASLGKYTPMSSRKSSIVALPHSKRVKQFCTPWKNCPQPTRNRSCLRADAPFSQVIPSKMENASEVLATVPLMGWLEFFRSSSLQPLIFPSLKQKQDSKPSCPLSCSRLQQEIHSAKLSFSQRSSHHFMVTQFPNQWCESSWETTSAMMYRSYSVRLSWGNMSSSLKVTMPAFYMAKAPNQRMKIWSYFGKGQASPNLSLKRFMQAIVVSKMSLEFFWSLGTASGMQNRDILTGGSGQGHVISLQSPAQKQKIQLGSFFVVGKTVSLEFYVSFTFLENLSRRCLVPKCHQWAFLTYFSLLNDSLEMGSSWERILHWSGPTTVRFIQALRSGWSKQGKTLFAPQGSKSVQRNCFPLSVKLMSPD